VDEVNIYWTKTALFLRNQIFEYWNQRTFDTAYSSKLNEEIVQRLQTLKTHPQSGKVTSQKEFRTISLKHYSIIYKTSNKDIYILAFWDNRQDSQKLVQLLNNS
jgi:toxin YoeB